MSCSLADANVCVLRSSQEKREYADTTRYIHMCFKKREKTHASNINVPVVIKIAI